MKPKLLLHVCCGPCSTYVIEELSSDYDVVCFFYNPSIWPGDEYLRRLKDAKEYCALKGIRFIEGKNDHSVWKMLIKGLESEPERGKRCHVCIKDRLKETARKAKGLGFKFFSSTLSISPHKDYDLIKECGNSIASDERLDFIDTDFSSGFMLSVKMSKEYGMYRQKYCGCEFSTNNY